MQAPRARPGKVDARQLSPTDPTGHHRTAHDGGDHQLCVQHRGHKAGCFGLPTWQRVLGPFQRLLADHPALEIRLTWLAPEVAALRPAPAEGAPRATAPTQLRAANPNGRYLADNLFLGLTAPLAAHWLATMLPHANRSVYRLAALAIAMPFGFRFASYATGTSGQVTATGAAFWAAFGHLLF